MTDPAEKLYADALALPEEDREALALRILATVPRTSVATPSGAVREAESVIEKAGVLPTTDAGNALVDQLLGRHTKGLAVRRREIVRRVEQVREGQVETESWAHVQAQLDDALSR